MLLLLGPELGHDLLGKVGVIPKQPLLETPVLFELPKEGPEGGEVLSTQEEEVGRVLLEVGLLELDLGYDLVELFDCDPSCMVDEF